MLDGLFELEQMILMLQSVAMASVKSMVDTQAQECVLVPLCPLVEESM